MTEETLDQKIVRAGGIPRGCCVATRPVMCRSPS